MEQAVNGSSPPVIRFRKQSGRRRDGLWLDTRTPGKPVWCIRYKGLDGKSHRERTEARTREQALALLHQRTAEVFKARIVGVETLEGLKPRAFEDFVKKEYLPHCMATHTPSTYQRDRSLAAAVLPTFGKMTLRAISAGDVQRYVDRRAGAKSGKSKKPVAPATVNRELMFVSGAMSEARRRGYVDRNPAQDIPQLPEHNDRIRWLTRPEEERLLGFMPSFLLPIVRTGLLTGMRQGEILALRWADLDFDQKLIQVTHTKNHKMRYIPMSSEAVELLKSIPAFVGKEGPSPFVFTNPASETRYKDVAHAFARVADKKAGLPDVTFHTLRHTFASRLVQGGATMKAVQELLGHGSMQMTMRYAHLAPNNLRDAVEILAQPRSEGEKRTRSVQTTPALATPS